MAYRSTSACPKARIGFCSTLRFSTAIAAACLWLGAPSLASAADVVFDDVEMFKGSERFNGVLDSSEPYFIEICVTGPDISSVIAPTVDTPISNTFPTGTTLTLDDQFGPDEHCFEETFATAQALDDKYPNGDYTVNATATNETTTDSLLVPFDFPEPTAFAQINSPTHGSLVPSDVDLNVTWTLVDQGGCNLGMPGTCLNGFAVFIEDDDSMGDGDLFEEIIFDDPAATSVLVDASVLLPSKNLEAGVLTFNGFFDEVLSDSLNTVTLLTAFEADNFVGFQTDALQQPITDVFVLKAVDRDDGVLITDPYFMEVCVEGFNLSTTPGLVTVMTPDSTDIPGGSMENLTQEEPGDSEFCWESAGFADAAALEDSYPVGDYLISAEDNSSDVDTVTVDFSEQEPDGFPDIFDPMNGSTVPAGQGVTVQWGAMTDKNGNCDPQNPGTCADGFLLFLFDLQSDDDLDFQNLPNDAGAADLDGFNFVEGNTYGIELESFRGTLFAPTISSDGNNIQVTTIYEDINFIAISVPEPSLALLQGSAIGLLAWLARRRRRAAAAALEVL